MIGLAVAAVGLLGYELFADGQPKGAFSRLSGPPLVALSGTKDDDDARFEQDAFDAVVSKYVDEAGMVDYAGLAKDTANLDAYIAALAEADLDELSGDARLATLINAYNAFTLRLIVDHFDGGRLDTIMDIPEAKRWDARRWNLGGTNVSLNQLEHEIIRKQYQEPRIHWALVCAAESCPPLRNEAYSAAKLESQLREQAKIVHTSGSKWFRYDKRSNTLWLTKLYKWYGGDFEQASGSVVEYVAEHNSAVRQAVDAGRQPRVKWLDYDWSLNRQK